MLADLFTAICDMLCKRTGAQVHLGLPGDTDSGVYVWPWRHAEDALANSLVPPNNQPAKPHQLHIGYRNVYFLVLVRPPLTLDGLLLLDLARRAIREEPVILVGKERVQLLISDLPLCDLSSLFLAASQPMSICLNVEARGFSDPPASLTELDQSVGLPRAG